MTGAAADLPAYVYITKPLDLSQFVGFTSQGGLAAKFWCVHNMCTSNYTYGNQLIVSLEESDFNAKLNFSTRPYETVSDGEVGNNYLPMPAAPSSGKPSVWTQLVGTQILIPTLRSQGLVSKIVIAPQMAIKGRYVRLVFALQNQSITGPAQAPVFPSNINFVLSFAK